MDEPGFTTDFSGASLSDCRVVIWGLGLMGGSLALALKGKCRSLVGIDTDPATLVLARERGIVDAAWPVEQVLAHPDEAPMGVDLIVLAAPVRANLGVLSRLGALYPRPAIVFDLGSTKAQVVRAMAKLPERFDPVGGHPMCGKEKFSLQYAEAGLFQGAPFALTPLERTSPRARYFVADLVQAIGARPLWIAPEDHDRWVAATSHLPFLLASALARSTPTEVAALVGPGFRSTARLSASSPGMMIDILATNADNILAVMHHFSEQLADYEKLLKDGNYPALAELFTDGMERYNTIVKRGEG